MGRIGTRALALLAAMFVYGAPPTALAFNDIRYDGLYLPFGVTTGASITADGAAGWLIGVEGSLVWLGDSGFWGGMYVDVLGDIGPDAVRVGVGPEFGWAFVGLDGGYVFEHRAGLDRHGVQVRAVVTMGFVGLFGRYDALLGPGPTAHIGEVGLLVKLPHLLDRDERPEPQPPLDCWRPPRSNRRICE